MPYIKKESLLEKAKSLQGNPFGAPLIVAEIEKADGVDIVFCKNCSWATERKEDNELFKYQCRNTIACVKPRRENDFCSYGKNK